MKPLDFDLSFDQTHWIASNHEVSLKAENLDELDLKIKQYLSGKYTTGQYTVKMYFDFDRFPLWMRQYMAHYFNRELTYQL